MSTSTVDVDVVDRIPPLHASDDRNTQYTYTQEGGFSNRQYNAQTINQTFGKYGQDMLASCITFVTITRKCKITATANINCALDSRPRLH